MQLRGCDLKLLLLPQQLRSRASHQGGWRQRRPLPEERSHLFKRDLLTMLHRVCMRSGRGRVPASAERSPSRCQAPPSRSTPRHLHAVQTPCTRTLNPYHNAKRVPLPLLASHFLGDSMLLMPLMLPMLPPPAVRDTLMLGQGQVKQGAAPPPLGLKCSACSLQVKEPATMEAPSMRWQEKDMARCWARAAAAR